MRHFLLRVYFTVNCSLYSLVDEALWLYVGDDVARVPLDRVPLLADDDAELLLLPLPQPQHLEGLGGARGGWQPGA